MQACERCANARVCRAHAHAGLSYRKAGWIPRPRLMQMRAQLSRNFLAKGVGSAASFIGGLLLSTHVGGSPSLHSSMEVVACCLSREW